MPHALIVDDDRSLRYLITQVLQSAGIETSEASTAEEGLRRISEGGVDLVLLDIQLPRRSGLDVLGEIQGIDRRIPIVIVTSDNDSNTAIEAMQRGAYDYLTKPVDTAQLLSLVENALAARELMSVPVALEAAEIDGSSERVFIGQSPQMLQVFKAIGRVAAQDVPILVLGESGTGKELVAQAIYQHSSRQTNPYLAINCAALPDSLLESELFGHEKGAFTGADKRRIGKFEQCHGGTIFLDEVGDMAHVVQGKVLRLLQEQRFERIGGNETISTNVRVIAATNRPLEEMVEQKTFRADLLFRLNGVTIHLPPLRERVGDIPLLLRHFLAVSKRSMNKPHIEGLSPESLELFQNYPWPGNVRELRSVVQQSVLNSTGPIIIPEFLPQEIRSYAPRGSTAKSELTPSNGAASAQPPSPAPREESGFPNLEDLREFIERKLVEKSTSLSAEVIEKVERYLFARVLQYTNGNQSQAAEILGITRGKVKDRVEAFQISLQRNVRLPDEGASAG